MTSQFSSVKGRSLFNHNLIFTYLIKNKPFSQVNSSAKYRSITRARHLLKVSDFN